MDLEALLESAVATPILVSEPKNQLPVIALNVAVVFAVLICGV